MNGDDAFQQAVADRLADDLRALADRNAFDHPTSAGIAATAASNGYESLTNEQKRVYDKYIQPKLDRECAFGCRIGSGDLDEFLSNGSRYCSYHLDAMSKGD